MALRKKSALRTLPELAKEEELLMFGYQCNIFRDDEKALFIDQGKHLIPWNGDEAIMIDRYDVRAYLSDLTEYDADIIRRRHEPLTDKERNLEALLDEERYLELRTDVTEKMMYEEEEMKRLNEAVGNSYSAVGFSYSEMSGSAEPTDGYEDQASLSYDPPYVVIPGLPLPPDMIVPATMKMHAIIEKTATFVSKQGVQMEIILKTKQRNNQQFEFLSYDNELNPYYRHLVNVIKQGKYKPTPPVVQPESEDHDDNHSYLHPSLTSSEVREPEASPMTSQEFLESIQSKLPAGQIANTSYAKLLSNLKRHASVVITRSADSLHLGQSSDAPKLGAPLLPPPPPPPVASTSQQSANASPVDYEESPERDQKAKQNERSEDTSDVSSCKLESKKKRDLVHGPLIVPPPPDQQPIIDKMADYVARNGPEFEIVVKMKKDERFQFLESDHVHHNYYQYKKQIFLKEMEIQKAEEVNKNNEQESGCETEPPLNRSSGKEIVAEIKSTVQEEEANEKSANNTSKAVSFSIKAKEEEVTSLKTRTALLYYSSASEDEDGQGSSESETTSLASKSLPHNLSRSSLAPAPVEKPTGNVEEMEKKQAEQKLADRLAAATREKLVRESKERQLQAQRKRKVAMFISMLKDINSDAPASASTSANTAAADSAATDIEADAFGGSTDSPFGSTIASRSVTPTLFLEQTASALNAAAATLPPVATAPAVTLPSVTAVTSRPHLYSRKRSHSRSRDTPRPPKRHRKRSKTPPTSYIPARRPTSKSPPCHGSHLRSKLKHSRACSRPRSHSKSKSGQKDVDRGRKSRSCSGDRKSKKNSESKKSSDKPHKKKSSKDHSVSRHHKSKKHKSKSKHRRSSSLAPDDQRPSKRSRSNIDKNNPFVVDLTGSPRAEKSNGRPMT